MHPSKLYVENNLVVLLEQIARQPFMTLAAAPAGRPLVGHAPVVSRTTKDGLILDFHLNRSNALAAHLEAGFPAVMVSLGSQAYISPDWYGVADQVPTWDYVAVEAEGAVTALDDEGLVRLLDDLAIQEERRLFPKPPWTRAKMTAGRFDTMMRMIIGVRLTVTRLEGTFKLSQNKDEAVRGRIVEALGEHPVGKLIAAGLP